jgi:hypothetical protein
MEPNYKLIYNKLQAKYPEIAEELKPINPEFNGYLILSFFTAFCRVKGVTFADISKKGNNDTRELFLGVCVLVFDPEYLFGYKKKLRKGLRPKIASLFGMEERLISYNLRKVKDFIEIYDNFRNEVEHIYKRVKIELNEKERQREEVNT